MTTYSNSVNDGTPAVSGKTNIDVISDNCVIIGQNTSTPWAHPGNVLSVETSTLIDKVITAVLFPVLYVLGAPGNLLNMAVFFKQSLKNRVHLCLFCLAVVDLIHLTFTLVLFADGFHTQLAADNFGPIKVYITDSNITGLAGARYASMAMAAIISVERCISTLLPSSTSQKCLPTKIVLVLILIVTGVVGFTRFAVTAAYRAACFYEVRTGRTLWRLTASEYYFQNLDMLYILDGILYGLCVAVGCPILVLVTTTITGVQLQKAVRRNHRESFCMYDKDIALTKMTIWLSVKFFLLSIPYIILRVSPLLEPRLSSGGQFANLMKTIVSVANLSSYLNSSVNVFLYYCSSARYRETCRHLLGNKGSSQHS